MDEQLDVVHGADLRTLRWMRALDVLRSDFPYNAVCRSTTSPASRA